MSRSSGAVRAPAVPPTLVDAKGDLLVGTADDTVGRLGVGSNGQVLTADASQAKGLKWAAPAGGGGSNGIPNNIAWFDSGNGVYEGTGTLDGENTYDPDTGVVNAFHYLTAGELGALTQTSDDFTIGTTGAGDLMPAGYGCIRSQRGGVFVVQLAVSPPYEGIVLDPSHTHQRHVGAGLSFSSGRTVHDGYSSFGLDCQAPVIGDESFNHPTAVTSGVSYVRPGKVVLWGVFAMLMAGKAGDSVPLTGLISWLSIAQIGSLDPIS